MQKRGKDHLLDFAELQSCNLCLDISRLRKLTFENTGPFLLSPLVLLCLRNIGQLTSRLRDCILARFAQENIRRNQGTLIPLVRVTQSKSERAQNTACALKALQVHPFRVENVGKVWMERIALEEALFRCLLILVRLLIQFEYSLQSRNHVRAEHLIISN